MPATEYRIFLASSQELAEHRAAFAEMLRRRNNDWVCRGLHLRLVVWEDFIDALSKDRLQAEYNKAIRDCDIFVMLFWTKVGRYTEEEFDVAFQQFKGTNKPFVYTYFHSVPVDPDTLEPADLVSRKAFQKRLLNLGHFQTKYPNVEGLLHHFWQQLDKLVANGFIRFPEESDAGTGVRYEATVTGGGAIAQGPGAVALGAGAVMIQGSNRGDVNIGEMRIGSTHRPRRKR